MSTKRIFTRDEKGVTAIEFAFLAPFFTALTFSAFETGYLYTKISLVDYALAVVARDVYTGKANSGEITYDDLEQKFCDNFILGGDDCTENLTLEMTEINSFADFPDSKAHCKYTNIPIVPVVNYDPGGSSSIVYLRACFVTEILIPGVGLGVHLPKIADDKYSIISSSAFVNEPF